MLQGVHPAAQHQRLGGGTLPHGARVARVHQDAAVHGALPGGRLHGHREGGADDQRVSRALPVLRPCSHSQFHGPPAPLSSLLPLLFLSPLLLGREALQDGQIRPAASNSAWLPLLLASFFQRGKIMVIVITAVACMVRGPRAGPACEPLESAPVLTRQAGPVSVLHGQVRSGHREMQ